LNGKAAELQYVYDDSLKNTAVILTMHIVNISVRFDIFVFVSVMLWGP